MKYEWKPSMSVGEKTIDSQHKQILMQITKMDEALASRDIDIWTLRDANHFLYNYFQEHFAYEEGYMAKKGFPGLEKHRKLHQSFTRFYDDFQRELMEKTMSKSFTSFDVKEMLEKIRKHLAGWLINHVMKIDHKYAEYIRKHSK